MNAVQLDLFDFGTGAQSTPAKIVDLQPVTPAVIQAPDTPRPAICEFDGPARRAGIDKVDPLNPCANCYLKEFCTDECAQLLFDIDVNDPVKYGWRTRK